MTNKKDSINFETSLSQLENLVQTMESGDLSLEDSLKSFEKGVSLVNQCRDTLNKAELQVETLLKDLPGTNNNE